MLAGACSQTSSSRWERGPGHSGRKCMGPAEGERATAFHQTAVPCVTNSRGRQTHLSDDGGLDGPDLAAPGSGRFLGTVQACCFLRKWREGILVGGRVALLF